MNKEIKKIIRNFRETSLERWSISVWINEIILDKIINKRTLLNLIDEMFICLDDEWMLGDSYLEIIIHDIWENNRQKVNIEDYLSENYKLELLINDNSEITRSFMKILKSKGSLKAVSIDGLIWKTYWIIVENYLHIYIYPDKNRLYFMEEWLYGKKLDYIFEKWLHLEQ